MTLRLLNRLKFREKINLSFGGLIVLVAINALVGIYTAYAIADQMRVQDSVERIVDEVVRMRYATDQFVKSRSRQAAQQTFTTLGQLRQMLISTGASKDVGHDVLAPLLPLLDDYQLHFQKYVIEADQKAALESRALLLGRGMMEALGDVRTRHAAAYDRETFDVMIGQVLSLQWQRQEMRAQQVSAVQLSEIRRVFARLRQAAHGRTQDVEAQRLLYRVLQDASDYLNSFESYLHYQVLTDKSERALADISAKLQEAAWATNAEARDVMRRSIPTSIAIMLAIFLVTLVGSGFAARRLSHAILKPIRDLLGTTQVITRGQLNERAAVTVNDEIGELARSFNQMTDSLRALQESLEQRVSERTQQLAEKNDSLRASEENLRTLFELAPLGITMTDMQGRYVQFNEAFREICGYSAEELMNLDYWALTPEKYKPEEALQLDALQRTGRYGPYEKEYRRKDGTLVPINLNGRLVTGADGESYTWSIVEDITERKATEAELTLHRNHLEDIVRSRTTDLINAKVAAEAANIAKSAFLANMSHELRTPMNGVLGMIDIAKRRMADAKGLEQLDKAKRSAERLLGVLNDILDLSKIEAERMVLEDMPMQLGQSADNIVGTLGHKATEKGLTLVVDLPSELANASYKGDPLRLGQILINLVGNAIKFTENGTATLRARSVGETVEAVQVRFEVIDTGIGIDAEAQSRLFQSFEQADNSMTRKYGGTGLGLAISKRLVQLMGGAIGVESTPGQGSTFWFVVPLKKWEQSTISSAPTFSAHSAEQRLQADYAGQRILLAEDEPITQEVSLGLLGDVGLVVDVAEDGQQALELARRNCYALILMDMQMPVMNGVEATLAIRTLPAYAQTPILAMTANAFDEDRQLCIDAGMNDHIAKPVNPQKLYETLLAWLEKRGT